MSELIPVNPASGIVAMPQCPLRALSVKQPFAALLVAGIKTVEIRAFRPCRDGEPATGWILVHASTIDEDQDVAWEAWSEKGHPHQLAAVEGAIIGAVHVAGRHRVRPTGLYSHERWEVCCSETACLPRRGVTQKVDLQWAREFHWEIDQAVACAEPVPCKGRL
jgi:hypothetical protein